MQSKSYLAGILTSLFLVMVVSSCGVAANPSPRALPTATIVELTQLPSPAPTFTSIPISSPTFTPTVPALSPETIAACKLRSYAFTNVGFGLPNPTHKLPSVGQVKTIVLFADFEDLPAHQAPEEVFSQISPNAEAFYSAISYGKMVYTLEPYFTWLRLSRPSMHYGEGIRSYDGHLQFIQEAVNLADSDVDFSTADSVLVMVPPEAAAVPYGPAFGANPNEGYRADGKVFSNGVTSGADLADWGFLWLNHETGHTMGLPDLYGYQADSSNYDDIHRYVGGFSLMGFIEGKAPEYFAFERWQLGWLDDDQIYCQLNGERILPLTAIETPGGLKAVMVPLSEKKVVVVESRRAAGYDANLEKEGALVYTVDTSLGSGEGTLVIYPMLENDPYRYQSPLAVGETVTLEGVTVTVLDATLQGDTIQVSVAK
jgi:M6 family metalloprotease-like protein